MDRKIDELIDGQMNKWIDSRMVKDMKKRCVDKQMDDKEYLNGWRQMNGWMYRFIGQLIFI